jgi:hypothetical protein
MSSNRRKSSINVLVDAVLQSSIDSPQHLSTQVSIVKDYRRFRTPKERVIVAASKYRRDILVKYGDWESILEFSKNTVTDFMMTQKEAGLPGAEVVLVYRRVAFLHVEEKAEYDPYRIVLLFFECMMGYIDLGTDIFSMMHYASQMPTIAIIQGVVMAFSFLCQFISSVGLGQPLFAGFLGLIGMKPMLEAFREATAAEPFVGQKLGNDMMLWLCRMTEMVVSQSLIRVVHHGFRCTILIFPLFVFSFNLDRDYSTGNHPDRRPPFNRPVSAHTAPVRLARYLSLECGMDYRFE